MKHRGETGLDDDPLWYKDAVIYEVHVRSFMDGNGDGIGDFPGLTSRLDYIESLGVTAIWLLPFFPSPLKDDGYDIMDYKGVHPDYGTIRDFKNFLAEAHSRGIRVIIELVINHTSDQHPWFRRARRARPGSAWRDFYVWSDSPKKYKEARIIFGDFERSNWTWDHEAHAYSWHRFYHHQPDLNFDNEAVHQEVFRILGYWLRMGVDGVRLDAVPYLYEREGTNCENLPETYAFLRKLRAWVDANYKNRMLLAEANQWPEDAVAYFGSGDLCHMAFHFPLMPRMFMALQMEDSYPLLDILEQTPPIPENCQWALFLRNHDELTLEMVTDEERDYMYRMYARDPKARINLGIRRRLAPLLENSRARIELMNVLLFLMPGSVVLYYGDEIGMGDNYYLGDRNGVRTPMHWSADRNAGFSRANPQQLFLPVIIDPTFHYEAVNVENQERAESSLLWWMRRLIALRKAHKAFSRGRLAVLPAGNPKVLAVLRRVDGQAVLAAVNLSRHPQAVRIALPEFRGRTPREMFSRQPFPPLRNGALDLTLGPYGYFLFELVEDPEAALFAGESVVLSLPRGLADLGRGRVRRQLEESVLPRHLSGARWLRERSAGLLSVSVERLIPVSSDGRPRCILELLLRFADGPQERSLLPLSLTFGEDAGRVKATAPRSVLAQATRDGRPGVLFDAMHDPEFTRFLLGLIAGRRRAGEADAELRPVRSRLFRQAMTDAEGREIRASDLAPVVSEAEQTNTSVALGDQVMLKLFRRAEDGPQPEQEVSRHLCEVAAFPNTPTYLGHIEISVAGRPPVTLAVAHRFEPNRGEAWQFARGELGLYFERILALRGEAGPVLPDLPGILGMDRAGLPTGFEPLIGAVFPAMIGLLGRRTAEMHLALCGTPGDPLFEPEPFTRLYQRSVYQSMQALAKQTLSRLEAELPRLDRETAQAASEVVGVRFRILSGLHRIMRRKIQASVIRIHGDFHLGHALFTGKDFLFIDFEGEPGRSVGERRLKRSALRDVAGMLRSLRAASSAVLLKDFPFRPEEVRSLEPWAVVWYKCACGAFLGNYLAAAEGAPFLPPDREQVEDMLTAFLLQRMFMEVGRELDRGMGQLLPPLRDILDLLGEERRS